jgi:hypothetical protein
MNLKEIEDKLFAITLIKYSGKPDDWDKFISQILKDYQEWRDYKLKEKEIIEAIEIELCEKLDTELYFPVKMQLEKFNIIHSLGIKKENFKSIIHDVLVKYLLEGVK